MSVISILTRLRQRTHELEANVEHAVRPAPKRKGECKGAGKGKER